MRLGVVRAVCHGHAVGGERLRLVVLGVSAGVGVHEIGLRKRGKINKWSLFG